jgi:hypothetical protein
MSLWFSKQLPAVTAHSKYRGNRSNNYEVLNLSWTVIYIQGLGGGGYFQVTANRIHKQSFAVKIMFARYKLRLNLLKFNVCRFVTMDGILIYGIYTILDIIQCPVFYLETRRFGDWSLTPLSGGSSQMSPVERPVRGERERY